MLLQQVHKGLHREGIVLGGHAEPVSPGGGTGVALFNQVGLLQHLADIAQKLVPRGGEDHAPVGPAEDGDVQLLL